MPRVKKKKKRVGEDKKSKKKCLNERETLSYEQQLLDSNRQLARLRNRNKELEEEAEITKEKYRQLEEDRSDVIAHLKRNLSGKLQETRELNERLSALEELRKDESVAFKKKEEAMELEYRTMENNLSAEVKLAAGKLNALEDWRLARLDLMQKFENQEKEIIEQEERHKKTLYDAEKSIVIGKSMMKKDMEERLKELSAQFRRAMSLRIAEATDRTVRENVALNQELDDILEVHRELEMDYKECKEADRMLRLQCELFQSESMITLSKTMKQRSVIKKMTEQVQEAILLYGKADRENSQLAMYFKISDECQKRCEQLEGKIRLLEQFLLKTKKDKEDLFVELKEKDVELDRLKSVLNKTKDCIMEALQLQGDIPEDYCANHLKHSLLVSLKEILEEGNTANVLKYTPSKVEGIECLYRKGTLGFVPSSEPMENNEKCCKQEKDDV